LLEVRPLRRSVARATPVCRYPENRSAIGDFPTRSQSHIVSDADFPDVQVDDLVTVAPETTCGASIRVPFTLSAPAPLPPIAPTFVVRRFSTVPPVIKQIAGDIVGSAERNLAGAVLNDCRCGDPHQNCDRQTD